MTLRKNQINRQVHSTSNKTCFSLSYAQRFNKVLRLMALSQSASRRWCNLLQYARCGSLHRIHVGPQILAVRSRILIGAGTLQMIVAAIAIVIVHEIDCRGGWRKKFPEGYVLGGKLAGVAMMAL